MMQFDPDNIIVKLCAKGMECELNQKLEEARELFSEAWNKAETDFEKFTAAHYVARHQNSVIAKLEWDEIALGHALKIKDEGMRTNFASLYLNIAKCHEDLNAFDMALKNYHLAQSYTDNLPDNGYGQIIKSGIRNGLERVLMNPQINNNEAATHFS